MSAPEPGLTVAAVARRLGVAPATLRTWERRYGVGPTGHVAGVRRRYTALDLARLERMHRLTLDGVAPSDAARVVLTDAATLVLPGPLVPRPGGPGGRVIAVPDGSPRARGLARAAQALDVNGVREAVSASLAEQGVRATWERLLVPVLRSVGERWAVTGDCVEVEHLLVECVTSCLRAVVDAAPEPRTSRPVLLAATDGEAHCLPLHVLAAALAERGVGSRLLGAAVPVDATLAAVRRIGPAALFAYSQMPQTARTELFDRLPVTRPPTAALAGGPGWEPEQLPRRVTYAHDLGEAVHLIEVVCGVG